MLPIGYTAHHILGRLHPFLMIAFKCLITELIYLKPELTFISLVRADTNKKSVIDEYFDRNGQCCMLK